MRIFTSLDNHIDLSSGDMIVYTLLKTNASHVFVFNVDSSVMFKNSVTDHVNLRHFLVFDRIVKYTAAIDRCQHPVPVFVDVRSGLSVMLNYIMSDGKNFTLSKFVARLEVIK